ncbi:MAG: protease modulator HflC [Woeseiaceae bacterium]|nr:protease modulator HflC [Woeseiaceae bacterium]
MNNTRFGALVIVGLILVIAGLSAFTVNERELALKLRFGEIREANYEPGLKFKIPLIETVVKFPRRILKIDDAPQEVFTLDRQNMTVDFFVKWKIVDEVAFYTSTGGSQRIAVERLREIIKNSVVTEFGKRSTKDAISVQRMELMRDMLALARPTAEGLGVELVDFRVKQVEFVARVRESVYEQMRAERQQLATQTRAEGREAAALISSTAEKDRTVILADANRESQIIRGEGDARAAEIYANAFNKDPEFYAFYRSINAYKNSIGQEGDVLVLDPNNEFFRYLNQSDGEQ